MTTLSLNKRMELYQNLRDMKIKAEDDPSFQFDLFEDFLTWASDDYTLDELAPILELDYVDFEDYINYLRDEAMNPYRSALRFMDRDQWKKAVRSELYG